MEFVNFYLVPGIVLGCIYALGAIGISLTFGILRFANFAHGEIVTFGAYVTLTLVWITGVHPLVVAPVAMRGDGGAVASGSTRSSTGRSGGRRRSCWSSRASA